ncbi:L,D-transpeptidase [Actinocorallia sp. A-T 12471]|uniref:L,D-transpeptidase n=1 Tax=Actinocorallia sp. A-T 12471 TaxID=3089813 RepID=UPI0029CC8D48|nr:Ig-like domain-containing protein [Actinocorallia sp. A-T 12471]MDX6743206.1 Ig-like domain-containing protein [Actinocorallia sp. A-T 12471]
MQVNRAATRAGAAGLLLVPLLASCSSEKPAKPEAAVAISPVNAGTVQPDTPVTVQASKGTLQNVTVTDAKGQTVPGVLAADRTSWQSRYPLDPSARYSVLATALGADGQVQTAESAFSTAKPSETATGEISFPEANETVGVGMPIKINFGREVVNKEAVEKALEVRASQPVEGAWRWFDDQSVIFRTKDYWPAHTKVRLIGHLAGVQLAKGVYGEKNLDRSFRVGERIETVGNAKTHKVEVKIAGKKARTMPASMGMGGQYKYLTTSGNHLTMEKEYMTVMTSPDAGPGQPGYYQQNVYWTVRISNSGEYLHSAPWSVGSQGYANVSHGCINLSPDNAKWFHKISHRGDPVKIVGTARPLEPENGWGYWQLDWKNWLKTSKAQGFTTAAMDGAEHAPAKAEAASKTPASKPDKAPAVPAAPAGAP